LETSGREDLSFEIQAGSVEYKEYQQQKMVVTKPKLEVLCCSQLSLGE
jgi:hypothetical protein